MLVIVPPVSVYALLVRSVSSRSISASASSTSATGFTPVYGRPSRLCCRKLWLMSQNPHSSLAPKYWQRRSTVR